MLFIASSLVLIASAASACSTQWPNGTDTHFVWWQCNDGPVMFYNATPYDGSGKNYEYPIHLGAPLIIKTDMLNPNNVYTAPNLRNTVNLWSWGGWAGCAWSSLPTFGLLKNLDACATGIPCPVKTGRQELNVLLDFSQFQSIIDMLKDDAPYQLQYQLHDEKSGDTGCITAQARSRIH